MAGEAIVLTGTVRTPLDAKRANDIASQFAQANIGMPRGDTYTTADQSAARPSTRRRTPQSKDADRPTAQQNKLVINLLNDRRRGAGDAQGDRRRGAAHAC